MSENLCINKYNIFIKVNSLTPSALTFPPYRAWSIKEWAGLTGPVWTFEQFYSLKKFTCWGACVCVGGVCGLGHIEITLQLRAMVILYFTDWRIFQESQNTLKINWNIWVCRGITILSCSYIVTYLFFSCYLFLLLFILVFFRWRKKLNLFEKTDGTKNRISLTKNMSFILEYFYISNSCFWQLMESTRKTEMAFTKRESFVPEGISHFLNIATYFFIILQQATWTSESLVYSLNFFFSLVKCR